MVLMVENYEDDGHKLSFYEKVKHGYDSSVWGWIRVEGYS